MAKPPNLERTLRSPKITTEKLAALWEAHGADLGVTLDRPPLINGTPFPDILRGQTTISTKELPGLANRLGSNPLVRSWRVFPLGIVDPDRFRVDIDLGKRVR